jgi:hypothetical protein
MGLEAGVGYSEDGIARSGMGVDAADYDGDGKPDLFVANLNRERFSLYRNLGQLVFRDLAGPSAVGQHTYMYSGWGLRFFDFDNDGDLDLVLANSHPDDLIEASHTGLKWKEPLLLLENGAGAFTDRSSDAGEGFRQDYPARGLATGDLDNDGFLDLIVANNGEAPVILHHRGGANRWIGLSGAKPGDVVRWPSGSRFVTGGGSYLSSQDPRLVIGLGLSASPEWIEIERPGGKGSKIRLVKPLPNRYHPIV